MADATPTTEVQADAPVDATGAEVDTQAREQTGQRQVRLRVDERNLTTNYANAFRTNGTADEVMIDFGMNMVIPGQGPQAHEGVAEILFQANDRIIMNYYSAKRLAITLTQLVRRHEQTFGELKLNAAERAQNKA